ncbi:MAG: hypothetical protein ABEJ55_04395 [Halanaeroarchaeum sp.]
MAAVPPPSDDEEPDSIAFGIPALDDRLRARDVPFPIDADELVRELGDPEIPYDPTERTILLSTVVERTDRQRFESRRDLLNAVHPILEAERNSGGVGEWLRRLLPI